jgi:hypothetical protein
MRLGVILSSQIINSDLAAEFGEIIPSELPLANRPLLHYQKLTISCCSESVIVTIPETYSPKWIDVKVLRCPLGLNLRSVIKLVHDSYQNYSEFVIYFGDALLDFEFMPNTFYIGTPKYYYSSWYKVFGDEVFVGLITISRKILSNGIKNSTSTLELIKYLENSLQKQKLDNWFDLGNYTSYYNSRMRYLESRSFNSVKVSQNALLTKSSADIAKIFYEYSWLNNYSSFLPAHFPTPKNFRITGDRASYEIEYFLLPSLADLLLYGKKDKLFWNSVIEKIACLIDLIRNCATSRIISHRFYSSKFIERIHLMEKQSFKFETYFAKCQEELAISLDMNDEMLVGSHGDLCFSNMFYDVRTETIKLIDPRGYMFKSEGQSLVMPKMYDVFKLAHSLVGGYDFVIASSEMPEIQYYFLDLFSNLFGVDKKWLFGGLSHLFFTMIPLHSDAPRRQEVFYLISKTFYADYTNCR